MPNSNSPHSRRVRAETAARWVKKQEKEGAYRLSVLIPVEMAEKLRALKEVRGKKSIRETVIDLIDLAPLETEMKITKKQEQAFMASRHPGMRYNQSTDSWIGDGKGMDGREVRTAAIAEIELAQTGIAKMPEWAKE